MYLLHELVMASALTNETDNQSQRHIPTVLPHNNKQETPLSGISSNQPYEKTEKQTLMHASADTTIPDNLCK